MRYSPTFLLRLVLALALLTIALSGCSQDDVTVPTTDPMAIAADPLDDALKSMDGDVPSRPSDRVARLADALGLDDDQVTALTDAYAVFRDGMEDLHTQVQAGDLTMEEAREAALLLREAFEAELQVILTVEQWDLLQEMRLAGREGRRLHDHDRNRDRSFGDRWVDILTEIGADEDQIAAVSEALDTMMTGMMDLRTQVQDGILTHEEAFEAAAVLRADFDAALQTILTEEQYAALLDLRPDCGGRHGH